MNLKLSLLLSMFIFLSLGAQVVPCQAESYLTISPVQAKVFLDSDQKFVLLDVRTTEEYLEKHIPHSILLPLDRLEQEASNKLTDKTVPIIVYCQMGKRSRTASELLIKLGYQHVYYLGGIFEWPYETISGENPKP